MRMMKKLILINLILLLLIKYLPDVENTKIEVATINNEVTIEEVIEQPIEPIIEETQVTARGLEKSRESTVEETKVEDKTLQGYRVTSYYPGDNCLTGTKTGSGKSTNDFSLITVEGKQVYSYQGKIVVAGATKELLKSGYNSKGSQESQNKHYFSYYDTGRIKINNNWYGFIVLDSCGAAMWKGYYRLDIFVPNSENVIDTKNVEIVYD